ncbi:hypothetical protein CAP36_05035 [Chitinophagaceae bacterium IBVUCB2]|nr:hypothetical protein CAP36_05035 [Chitinophagaceae bacterium IBVUCB2]
MYRLKENNWKGIFLIGATACLLAGCSGKDKSASTSFDPENIFFDYKISGRETDDNLTVLLQFRDGGEEGDAISVAEWGKVTLDGEILAGDSTKRTGFFYEAHKPAANFSGKHIITLAGGDNEEYKEDFTFERVELITPIPDTLTRDELVLEFQGLEPEDYLRVLILDTSIVNDGINRVDTLKNGRLIITKEDFENLDSGPIQLLFFRELEKPTKTSTNRGGRWLITYSLGREFFLKD